MDDVFAPSEESLDAVLLKRVATISSWRVLWHGAAAARNLLRRQREDDEETVADDRVFVGLAGIGEEASQMAAFTVGDLGVNMRADLID